VDQAQGKARDRVAQTIKQIQADPPISDVLPGAWAAPSGREQADFSFNAAGPLALILEAMAKQGGYAVVYATNVNRNAPTAVGVSKTTLESAIRKAAAHAGYAVVIDRRSRAITVLEEATYTFRLPLRTIEMMETTYDVGGNPTAAGGTAQGGGGAAGGVPTAPTNADIGSRLRSSFATRGRSANPTSAALSTFLASIAGPGAQVSVAAEMGLVTARGNGTSLLRLTEFLDEFGATANLSAQLRVTMVEVNLDSSWQVGVDLQKTITGAGWSFAQQGAALVVNPSSTVGRLGQLGSDTVVNAIAKATNGRIINQPSIVAYNRQAAQIFSGKQVPFLGSLQTNQTQAGITTSGAVSYATDGVSLSVRLDLENEREGELLLLPVLTGTGELRTFPLGATSQLSGYEQSNAKAFLSAPVRTGQMLIIGGIRYSRDTLTNPSLSSTGKQVGARELIIIVEPTIYPGRDAGTLFRESI
jgi:hypothetical protein